MKSTQIIFAVIIFVFSFCRIENEKKLNRYKNQMYLLENQFCWQEPVVDYLRNELVVTSLHQNTTWILKKNEEQFVACNLDTSAISIGDTILVNGKILKDCITCKQIGAFLILTSAFKK